MRVLLPLLVLLAVTSEEVVGQPAAPPREQAVTTIVTLGDSITKGVRPGVSSEQTFAALVEQGLRSSAANLRVINAGIGGERTDQALQRLDRIIAMKPHIVTVMYGANDSYIDQGKTASRITSEAFRSNLTQIVVELLRRGILPVVMTEPPWAADATPNGIGENPNVAMRPFIEATREVAAEWRVPLIDHFAQWSQAEQAGQNLREWTTDGLHPNPAGHRVIARAMVGRLTEALAAPTQTRRKLLSGEPVRIVCFGDSVTGVYYHTGSRRAYTDMLGLALRRVAGEDSPVEMFNAGISGHTTNNALDRIERDVLQHKPDLVTVMFGLNDMTRVPLEDYGRNLRTIVEKCRATGAEVILCTPNNVIDTPGRPADTLIEYCDAVRTIGRELDVPVCDCYRELAAVRAHDPLDWRLMMSDEIHPNMDGHQRIAEQLTRTITGAGVSLDDVGPPQPLLLRTRSQVDAGRPLRVLAMQPLDTLVAAALKEFAPEADVELTSWTAEGMTLPQIEQEAQAHVRTLKPDLVVLTIPDTAAAQSTEEFVRSAAWTMNYSLSFGPPGWDCVVVHPTVIAATDQPTERHTLLRRLVAAQDLPLIDRPEGSTADAAAILNGWFAQQRNSQ
jgi:lysophospholipase L1-like esterase